MKFSNGVLYIGPYPPPYGGVSIHIKRLKERLEKEWPECSVYDNSGVPKKELNIIYSKTSFKWLFDLIRTFKKDIIHYHGYKATDMIFLSLLVFLKRSKIVITLHSFRYDSHNINLLDRIAFWMSKKTHIYFIAVGTEIKNRIKLLGIDNKYIEIIPAFIPPPLKEEEEKEIPLEAYNFIKSHNPVISANAFKISFHNSQDLYGIDMCVELCAALKKYYPNLGLIFCLPEIGDYPYFNKILQTINEKKIKENVFFQTKPCQFYPLLMKCDVFARPTNTDGDAISLREALYFKIPSIASNAVPRPEGTIIFKNRDIKDFIRKTKNILDKYEEHKKRLDKVAILDNTTKVLKVYKNLQQHCLRS